MVTGHEALATNLAIAAEKRKQYLEQRDRASFSYQRTRLGDLLKVPALHRYLRDEAQIHESLQAHIKQEAVTHGVAHGRERMTASLYEPLITTVAEDPRGLGLLLDAIDFNTQRESDLIKSRGGGNVDVFVLGTGVNATGFVDALRTERPDADILMACKDPQRGGTLSRLNLQLNTDVQDDNLAPGGHENVVVEAHDLASGNPMSKIMRITSEVNSFIDAPAVVETELIKIRHTTDEEKLLEGRTYAIEMRDLAHEGKTLIFYADEVHGAPGTGKEKQLPGADKLTPQAKERVKTFEEAMVYLDTDRLDAERKLASLQSLYQLVAQEGIAVTGGEDSSRVAVETIIAHLQEYLDTISDHGERKIAQDALRGKISWQGIKYDSQASYLAYLAHLDPTFEGRYARYSHISQYFPESTGAHAFDYISPVEGHVGDIVENANHFPITRKEAKTPAHEGDTVQKPEQIGKFGMVIEAIGYDPIDVNQWIDFGEPVTLTTIYGDVDGDREPIARQVIGENLSFFGAFCQFLPLRRRNRTLQTKQPSITMGNMIPRSRELARQVAGRIPYQENKTTFDQVLRHAMQRRVLQYGIDRLLTNTFTNFSIENANEHFWTTNHMTTMLADAQKAHHKFQDEELKGVRDETWVNWYATHIVESNQLPLSQQEMARLLEALDFAYNGYTEELQNAYQDDQIEEWTPWVAERFAQIIRGIEEPQRVPHMPTYTPALRIDDEAGRRVDGVVSSVYPDA